MAVNNEQTTSITAENTGTNPILVTDYYTISLGNSGVGTITLQGRPYGTTAWIDDDEIIYNGDGYIATGLVSGKWEYRLFCKTGNFTSGTIDLTFKKG